MTANAECLETQAVRKLSQGMVALVEQIEQTEALCTDECMLEKPLPILREVRIPGVSAPGFGFSVSMGRS